MLLPRIDFTEKSPILSISVRTIAIKDTCAEIEKIFKAKYQLTNNNLNNSLTILKDYLACLQDNLFVMVEYPYVDKTYRDTYCNYFASKKDDYPRNTPRKLRRLVCSCDWIVS